MYNYFIQTKKKTHKVNDKPIQWLDAEGFRTALLAVKTKDQSKYIKSWRSKVKNGKSKSKR